MTTSTVDLDGRPVGPGHPPYLVAELSGNHFGDKQRALDLMTAAKEAGVDAVKLQTYRADTITIDHDGPEFRIENGAWAGYRLHDLYHEASTPWEWHGDLFAKGHELGLTVFSSPFDATAVSLLEELGAPLYKIASFELIDLPLIERVAATGKTMIMSTGLADAVEIAEAVQVVRRRSDAGLVLLHCISGYPTPPADSNLLTMPDLAQRFEVITGLSDHPLGTAVAVAAVALGAHLIEKHLTLARGDGGPDSSFSLEPDEFATLVSDCRTAWESIGAVDYTLKQSEMANQTFRRSIYVVANIDAGETFTERNVRTIRPGFGLAPKHLPGILNKRAAKALKRGIALEWSMIAD